MTRPQTTPTSMKPQQEDELATADLMEISSELEAIVEETDHFLTEFCQRFEKCDPETSMQAEFEQWIEEKHRWEQERQELQVQIAEQLQLLEQAWDELEAERSKLVQEQSNQSAVRIPTTEKPQSASMFPKSPNNSTPADATNSISAAEFERLQKELRPLRSQRSRG